VTLAEGLQRKPPGVQLAAADAEGVLLALFGAATKPSRDIVIWNRSLLMAPPCRRVAT
jgi:hypothetical protein